MRPVHYAASGRGGLAFRCYYDELRPHIEEFKARDAMTRQAPPASEEYYKLRKQRAKYPSPRCHTDLSKVTCHDCWLEIYFMAQKQLTATTPKPLAGEHT